MARYAAAGASRGCPGWRRRSSGSRSFRAARSSWRSNARLRADCVAAGHGLGQKEHTADRWIAATAIRLRIPLVSNDEIFRGAQASTSRRSHPADRQRDPQRYRMYRFGTRARLLRRERACGQTKRSGFADLLKHGASRTRTGDLLGAIQALSQLSYSPGRRQMPRGCGTV
jgi:hypothetical protein